MILHRPEVIRQYHDDNQWGTRTLDDLFQENVHRHPERLAVAEAPNRTALTPGEPRRLTYAELSGEVERTAAGLLANGVGKDSVVVVQLPNIVELLLLYLACARIGAVISPMPMQYREHEIGQLLDALGPVGAIVTVAWFKREQRADAWEVLLRERGNRTPLMAYGDDSGRHAPPCSASMDTPRAREAVARYRAGIDISADDIYTICWTSGTTSTPKGVPRSHNNWLLYARIVSEVCDVRDGERMLNPFSFVNLSGIGISLVIWLFKAGTVHLHHPFDREVFLRQVADEHISLAVAAPAMLSAILGDPTLTERHDLRSLRCVMSGSTGLSGTMIAEYERRFGIAIVNGFGSNEGITLTSSAREIPNPLRRAEYFPRIGAPDVAPTMRYHRWIHSKLVDPESGQEIVMPGISGELLMKSGAVFPGYYRRPELTAEVFDPDGYFRTGDLFQIALGDEGQPTLYRFVGRLRSVINRGGMKISPEELGGLMEQHPSIAEADAIGYPDAVLGERVCACVALRPNTALALADLVAFLADQGIAKYKLPERLVILDQLPRNPIGKVQREPLRLAVLGVPQDASVAP